MRQPKRKVDIGRSPVTGNPIIRKKRRGIMELILKRASKRIPEGHLKRFDKKEK